MSHKGEVSKYHTHKDGSSGWDINVKSERGDTDHKMHVEDRTGVDRGEAEGFLSGVASVVGSIFDAIFGGKKD